MSPNELIAAGVPDPDGTAVGDALHVLSCQRGVSDDTLMVRGTDGVYGDAVTGLSMGDLRELVRLAALGEAVEAALGKRNVL